MAQLLARCGEVAREQGADLGEARAHRGRVAQVVALGEIGHFLVVVAGLAAGRFDLAHEAVVERGKAEVVAGVTP
jgi:hypothetical protein